jgi:uncharacterized membrane protein
MCYNMQISVQMFAHVPFLITWFICQTMMDYLNLVVSICILNRLAGHWLLSLKENFKYMTEFMIRIPIIKD